MQTEPSAPHIGFLTANQGPHHMHTASERIPSEGSHSTKN